MEITNGFNGTPIDITSKTNQDWVTTIDGQLSSKSGAVTLNLIYNSNDAYQQLKSDAMAGNVGIYKVDFTGNDADAIFMEAIPTGLSDDIPQAATLKTAVSFATTKPISRGVPL